MITGALGNVGGYVAKYAIENGQDVVCADIDIQALNKKFGDKTKNVYFDFTDAKTFKDALDGVDRVFIMRPPHLGKPERFKTLHRYFKRYKAYKVSFFLIINWYRKKSYSTTL